MVYSKQHGRLYWFFFPQGGGEGIRVLDISPLIFFQEKN